MTTLADHIAVVGRFARSANLERDVARTEPLDGYVVTARALDVVERIANTAVRESAGGAWSLTGPYGSGKSSLALLLDAAFGESGQRRELAWELVSEVSPTVTEVLAAAHRKHDTVAAGFHRGLATASREPISHTVLRALHSAVVRRYGEMPSTDMFAAADTLKGALADTKSNDRRRTGPSPAALVEVARCLAAEAPLLLVIDEFGKNLEAVRDGSDADPYLLQQLAEAGQGLGARIFMLTLQHLSFEDYLAGTDGPQRREWAKVQGRFEDIAYVESATQTRALIGTAFRVPDSQLRERIGSWAKAQANAVSELGIPDLSHPSVIASCYPLHPLTAAVLPELCNRYGQHERTLFSFLTAPDPASAASFLMATQLPERGPLPSLGLETLYDYFVGGGALTATHATQSSRWTEVATRIRDTHGLSDNELRLAKVIAVLNLVSTSGTLRASRAILALTGKHVGDTLADLEATGIATYRNFADEYRIWYGTDIDIRQLLDSAHARIQRQPLVEVLTAIDQPSPVVAAGHSAKWDILRMFSRRYVEGVELVEPPDPFSPFDGEALLVVGADQPIPTMARPGGSDKPVVVAIPTDLAALDVAAREVSAITAVLTDTSVADDWVARRELGERLAKARAEFDHAVTSTFSSAACRWLLVNGNGPPRLESGRGSAPISEAAERMYQATPMVRNEMLNRTELTSQGAKARRILLEAMIEHGEEPELGLKGYGPDMAMYRAFLLRTGMHGNDDRNATMTFRGPRDTSLMSAWQVLEDEFRRAKTRRINLTDIYATLLSPPFGMKLAVIPVFITVGLLVHSDEVAIYEHGTFKPMLTADLSERMVRNPGHFDLKHFANATGARRQVIDALAAKFGVRPRFRKQRVANVLAIVGHLVSEFRHLDNYTLRTSCLSERTIKVRGALAAAVEPDELVFATLPAALGFDPVPASTKPYVNISAYVDAVGDVIDELLSCFSRLLEELLTDVLNASAETNRLAITGQAAALQDEVLDPAVRAFVLTLANDSVDSDTDWVQAVATVVSRKAPAEWNDNDRERFRRDLLQQIAAFQRLVALHAEQRVTGAGPFDALRVTFTGRDGREHHRLVSVDQAHRPRLDAALDQILEESAEIIGTAGGAHYALLALLGERLLPEPREADDAVIDSIKGKVNHG